MMISPNSFVEGLKDADYKTLIKERNRLVRDLKDFEKYDMDSDRTGPGWMILPSPETIYQMNLEYMAALCTFMQEKYNNEYVWGGEAPEEDE